MGNTPAVYYTYIEVNFILTMLLFQLIFLNNQYLNNVEYFRLTSLRGILVILIMLQILLKKIENSDLCVLDVYLIWDYIDKKRKSNGQA